MLCQIALWKGGKEEFETAIDSSKIVSQGPYWWRVDLTWDDIANLSKNFDVQIRHSKNQEYELLIYLSHKYEGFIVS